MPVKETGRLSDISKHGGFDKARNTYFMLVKAENKKGRECTCILPVPLYLKQKMEDSEIFMKKYFEQEYQLTHVRLEEKIKIQTLFVYQGFRMRLAGRSGSQIVFHNANELCFPAACQKTIRQIGKHMKEVK